MPRNRQFKHTHGLNVKVWGEEKDEGEAQREKKKKDQQDKYSHNSP